VLCVCLCVCFRLYIYDVEVVSDKTLAQPYVFMYIHTYMCVCV
jgi:hypothetical protein